jgi:hypothetical protein
MEVWPRVSTSLRQANKQVGGEPVICGAQNMDEIISDSLAVRRFSMIGFGVSAALALGLSSVGIDGVSSYPLGQRTHDP